MQGRERSEQTKDMPHIDGLLQRLAEITQHDPSPILRERLSHLASRRLVTAPADRNRLVLLKLAFGALLPLVVGFSGLLIVRHSQHEGLRSSEEKKSAKSAETKETRTTPKLQFAETQGALPHEVARVHVRRVPDTKSKRMAIQLPYSNSAVATGTDATIRVAMSQSELLSLGFPVNATVRDHRVLAELTLGDDGLPRAVSLTLPLEIVKEEK